MAARRMLLALLVVLIISSFVAALAPVDPPREGEETTTTAPAEPAKGASSPGRLIERTVEISPGRVRTVRVALGNQLALSVEADRADEVEIPALGELEDVDPVTPAVFDLLPADPGRYAVRLLVADRRVATIEVTSPDPERARRERPAKRRS